MKKNFIKYPIFLAVVGLIVLAFLGTYLVKRTVLTMNKPTENLAGSAVKPNVIIVDICSLRADHLSGNGYARPTTPNLDAFANGAASFDNFWTESGWCLPNFATMLTGTRPEIHHKVFVGNTSPLPQQLTTLAEIFNKNGFKTAGFSGSRYLVSGAYGLERGFETLQDAFKPEDDAMGAASFEENLPEVRTWLSSHKDNPFFLYVTIDDLHSPYSRSDNPKLFDPAYHGILDTVSADIAFSRVYNGENLTIDPKVRSAVVEFKKDPRHLKNLVARYDAALVHVDGLLGKLFDELKKNGLWDKSIIIVTAHQGELFGEHALLGHARGIYEPILHVPFLIHYPGITSSGSHFSQLTERIDIPATILDVMGLLPQYKEQYTGTSLLPILQNPDASWKNYIFASNKPIRPLPLGEGPKIEERAVRNDRYKLIWYGYNSEPYELYDLKNDPEEKNNLVHQLPDVFAELKSQLDAYVGQYAQ